MLLLTIRARLVNPVAAEQPSVQHYWYHSESLGWGLESEVVWDRAVESPFTLSAYTGDAIRKMRDLTALLYSQLRYVYSQIWIAAYGKRSCPIVGPAAAALVHDAFDRTGDVCDGAHHWTSHATSWSTLRSDLTYGSRGTTPILTAVRASAHVCITLWTHPCL